MQELEKSLPAWERGLKLLGTDYYAGKCRSLPAWERGLKPLTASVNIWSGVVAPCVGAWIETVIISIKNPDKTSRSLRGSVD